jgi:hypothetical protein
MGNLRLPQPSQAGLPEGIVQLAFQFQHHLDILSKRDLRGESATIYEAYKTEQL